MYKPLKWLLVTFGLGFMLYVGLILHALGGFAIFDKTYSKKDLIDNYNQKSKELYDLRGYFRNRVPENISVHLEFDGDKLAIFRVAKGGNFSENRATELSSTKVDSLLHVLGWSKETLSKLKIKLNEVNCISIESGEPITRGYHRRGLGMYSYKLFTHVLNDSLRENYNDGCAFIHYKDDIVLEYRGGAIGPQCFEDFKIVK